MKLIYKLLRRNISAGQLLGFFIANLVGYIIILTGVQLYSDLSSIFDDHDGFTGSDYMVITKPVNAPQLTESDIERLRQQPFVKDIGRFVPSQFRVYGEASLGRHTVGTYMFFEAIPDKFIDISTENWKYDEETGIVPVVIPKGYLNLYNLGFAKSQGLPQISEDVLKTLPMSLFLGNPRDRMEFDARIVGFTTRVNTVLVPYDFILWANEKFAPNEKISLARIILEVENSDNEEIGKYLEKEGYEVEGNAADSSKGRFLVRAFLSILLLIGGTIYLLSVYILALSIHLLLHKNSEKLLNLMALGYTPQAVARPYMLLTTVLNLLIMGLGVLAVYLFRRYYVVLLSEVFTLTDTGFALLLIVAAALSAAIIAFNCIIIKQYIKEKLK